MHAVEITNVTKTFGETVAVHDLSLQIPRRAIYGLIGPNGSGKTTTMRMIMNILYPDHGAISVFGKSVFGRHPDDAGYLPEERGLYKKMNVRELLQFFGELKSEKRAEREVDEWLERLQLREWADKKVEALSKGMSRKVQFIAAVVTRPALLVLDEPFSGLDPVNADIIRRAILELRAEGATVILSTHDMTVAENMCDYICMIFRGRKVLDGTLASIQSAYGEEMMRVRCDDGAPALRDIPGIAAMRDFGQMQELRLAPQCNPQQILQTILARTAVRSFDLMRPSLHSIFVRIAGPHRGRPAARFFRSVRAENTQEDQTLVPHRKRRDGPSRSCSTAPAFVRACAPPRAARVCGDRSRRFASAPRLDECPPRLLRAECRGR